MEDRIYSHVSKFQYQLKEFKTIRCEFIMQVKENAYAIYKLGMQIPRPKTLEASTRTPYWSFQWRSYSQCNQDLEFPDPDTKVLDISMKPSKRDNQPPVEIITHSCRMDRPDTSICSSKHLKKFVLIGPPPPPKCQWKISRPGSLKLASNQQIRNARLPRKDQDPRGNSSISPSTVQKMPGTFVANRTSRIWTSPLKNIKKTTPDSRKMSKNHISGMPGRTVTARRILENKTCFHNYVSSSSKDSEFPENPVPVELQQPINAELWEALLPLANELFRTRLLNHCLLVFFFFYMPSLNFLCPPSYSQNCN